MITEAYIKGRCDYGVGKCAVVIVEGGKLKHQAAWKVGESFEFGGKSLAADQYNCEIIAACYVLDWCRKNERKFLNIYTNTKTCQKWYYRREFPEERELGKTFNEYAAGIDIYADYIPKNSRSEGNMLVNDLATSVC